MESQGKSVSRAKYFLKGLDSTRINVHNVFGVDSLRNGARVYSKGIYDEYQAM